MIYRTFDDALITRLTESYPAYVDESFDAREWLEIEDNIALSDGVNISLFEADAEKEGTYEGHYLFRARGQAAFELAKEMLSYMLYTEGAKLIIGRVPADNKAAATLTRRLGFESYGVQDSEDGFVEIFHLRGN